MKSAPGEVKARTIELIRAIDKAGDQMIDIENLSDLELDELQTRYEKIRAACDERQKTKSHRSKN